jgi:hypothetical protein
VSFQKPPLSVALLAVVQVTVAGIVIEQPSRFRGKCVARPAFVFQPHV